MRNLIDIIKEMEQVNESPEEVRSAIVDRVQNMSDEQDLTDVLKYTNRFNIKQDVSQFANLRKYKDVVSKVLLKSLANANLPTDQVRDFLKKLSTDGIINTGVLLTPGVPHSIDSIIDSNYRSEFDAIKGDLYTQLGGKHTGEKGSVGNGEFLLSIMSPKINRSGGGTGDLDIDGTTVELKAGKNGRIGPEGTQQLYGRFKREFLPVIEKLVPEKASLATNPADFNFTRLPFFTEFFETEHNVKEALSHMLKMIYPDYDTRSIADIVVGGGGVINKDELKSEMLKASYSSYQKAKGFDGIMIMNADVTTFLYINTPEQMAKAASSLGAILPRWEDKQSDSIKVSLLKGSAIPAEPIPAVINEPPDNIQASAGGVAAEPLGTKNTMGRTRRKKT